MNDTRVLALDHCQQIVIRHGLICLTRNCLCDALLFGKTPADGSVL
jgi:hypothetical protein